MNNVLLRNHTARFDDTIGTLSARIIGCTVFLLAASVFAQDPAQMGNLRAGAAKVDITPAADAALPMSGYAGRIEGFKGIHDDLNVRAIVVDDGVSQAAI